METQLNDLLLEVKSSFDHWRATRTKRRERTPEYLWSKVQSLIGRYPLQIITTTLGINTYQLREHCKLNDDVQFVQAKIDSSTAVPFKNTFSVENKQTCSIELHKANVILKINDFPLASLLSIITPFIGN